MTHAKLWNEVDGAVGDFWDDLVEHDRAGRHGGAGVHGVWSQDQGQRLRHGPRFRRGCVRDRRRSEGRLYGEYPSLKEEEQLEGDLHYNNDFRSTYSTLLEDWMGLEASPIVNGQFEHLGLFGNDGNGK